MKDKIVLITGSTDGIGKQTAHDIANYGATVLVHGRDSSRVESTVEQIKKETKNINIKAFVADFASLDEVRKLAAEIREKQPGINILINNAGIFMRKRQITTDNFETTFQVNHLAPFLLTNLILDLLKNNSPARIINVSSDTHRSSNMDFGNLQGERHYNGYEAYSLSKLANVLFTIELAEKLNGTGVTVNALHPGGIGTKLLHEGWGGGGASVKIGAETPVYLAVSEDVKNISGKYFVNSRSTKASSIAYDKKLRKEFWELSEKLVNLKV